MLENIKKLVQLCREKESLNAKIKEYQDLRDNVLNSIENVQESKEVLDFIKGLKIEPKTGQGFSGKFDINVDPWLVLSAESKDGKVRFELEAINNRKHLGPFEYIMDTYWTEWVEL